MNRPALPVHNRPCSGCPYRKDCPSGVWHASEYRKLAEYDKETGEQPPAVFLCHDGGRQKTLCRGWLDTHDKEELLALRLAIITGMLPPEIYDLPPSDVPVFESGEEAMKHGMKGIKRPDETARSLQQKLLKRHPDLKAK